MRPPPVDWWGRADGTLGQDAGPLELHCGLGDMVALFGCKLSVLPRRVLKIQYHDNFYTFYSLM